MKKILFLALLIVISGAGCLKNLPAIEPNNEGNSTTTANPISTSTTPVTPTSTANSTNKLPVDATPFGFTRITDQKAKFRIDYPSRWKQNPQTTADLAFLQLSTRISDDGIMGMAIVRVTKELGITQAAFNTRLQKNIDSFGPKKEGEDYNISYINFAGQKNVIKFVSTNTKENPRYAETYVVVRNETIYVISYQSSDDAYQSDLPLYKKMVDSFKLL